MTAMMLRSTVGSVAKLRGIRFLIIRFVVMKDECYYIDNRYKHIYMHGYICMYLCICAYKQNGNTIIIDIAC